MLIQRDFPANVDVISLIDGHSSTRPYTWETQSSDELSLQLNTCVDLEQEGWTVCLQSPVRGASRSYRVPVAAVKDETVIFVKPVADPKKVNIAGLKMTEAKIAAATNLSGLTVKAVVYAFLDSFNESRRSSSEYEIWLKG